MTNDPVSFARHLRKSAPWAERLLWKKLRDRRVMGVKFRRQQPLDRYTLDFYCAERRLAIELDGCEHGDSERVARDETRDAYLKAQGIRVVRVWNSRLRVNLPGVLEQIRMALAEGAPETPHPNPLPQGERGAERVGREL